MENLAYLFIYLLALLLFIATLPGTLELAFLTLGALLPKRRQSNHPHQTGKLIVIVPTHNEEKTILRTLNSLKNTQSNCDIVVIADHCTDQTKEIVQDAGVRVLPHEAPYEKGKNHALHDAFHHLLAEGYTWFVVVDADSIVEKNFINEIETHFASGANAIQVRYGVLNPNDSLRTRLMNLAFSAFNYLRPRGRNRLGFSAGILGNGFGISKLLLEKVPFTVDSVVEDLSYHIKLVTAGFSVSFIETTTVYGEIPSDGKGVATQRLRWEGGRLKEIVNQVPTLLRKIFSGQTELIEPLFELLLLPLAYHVVLLFILLWIPIPLAQIYAFAAMAIVVFHLIATLFLTGGNLGDLLAICIAPFYIIWKLGMLLKIVKFSVGPQSWNRTERIKKKRKPPTGI